MLRFIISLLIIGASFAPAAAFAQNGSNVAENVAETVTNTATTTTTTTNTAETTNVSAVQSGGDPRPAAEIDREPLEASGSALLKLFVLAVILESALALLFTWRPFVAKYDGRGVKMPISLGAALFLTFYFQPNAIATLMDAYDSDTVRTAGNSFTLGRFFSQIIEAMVIAGGSAGVNRLMVALGFRSQTRAEEVVPKPKRNEAWISVGLDRQEAVGPVYVEIQLGEGPAEIAGTIAGTRAIKRSYFRRDYGRLPPAGGWSVPTGKDVRVTLVDQAEKRSETWGPYRLAERAIVDIDLAL